MFFKQDQRQSALLNIKIKRFFVSLFDFFQHVLIFLAIIWLANLSWFGYLNLAVSEVFRDQIPISPRLVLIDLNNFNYSPESLADVVGNLHGVRALAVDASLSESTKEVLSKQNYPIISSESDGIYRSNITYTQFNVETSPDRVESFRGIYGQKGNSNCMVGYAYAIYIATEGLGDPCNQKSDRLYNKPTSYTPFLAEFFGLTDISLIPGPDQGTNSFTQTEDIYFTRSQSYDTFRLDDLIDDRDRFNLKDKIILIGSGARLELAAAQLNSLLQGAVYSSVTAPTALIILGIVVVMEILFFVFNNSNYQFFREKYKSESQMIRIFSQLRYQGVHLTFEFVGYLLFFGVLGLMFLVLHYQIPWVSLLVVLIMTKIYLAARSQVSLARQKTSLERAFSRYVNPALLGQIQQNMGEVVLGGERREVTVVFADVRGFTSLSEQISSMELVSLLNNYLNEMSQIVFKHDGTIDKFMGDGLMAMWNAPLLDPDHAVKAVRASLRMVRELEKFNQTKLADYRLKIGIGINTGEVIVGNVGSNHRLEYTAIGSNVNLASRIEGLSSKYGADVLISELVFEEVQGQEGLIFRLIDIVTVKGNHKPMRLYEPMLDTGENRDKKYKYEKAYYYYQRLDWATAYDSWREIPNDRVAIRMIERIMLQGGLARGEHNWDGVWRWSDK